MKKAMALPVILFTTVTAILIPALSNTTQRTDLNSATQIELQRIPGIGPSLATRIVMERNRRGGFRAIHDLLKVQGISYRTLQLLENHLYVSETTFDETQEKGLSDFHICKPCNLIKETL